MRKAPQLDNSAPWKERFRAPVIAWTQIARLNYDRGLVCSDKSGIYQLYAWNIPSGEIMQLTDKPTGIIWNGAISPDGRYVTYLDDAQGNEIGHYVRIPFEGGAPEDLTPDLPPYASFDFTFSRSGNSFGLIAGDQGRFKLYTVPCAEDGALGSPRLVYKSKRFVEALCLSYDGDLAAFASTERTGTLSYSVVAVDTESGEKVAELWDGPDGSVEPVMFSPLQGDTRLLATTNRSGVKRPLIWDPRTEERRDLDLGDLEGEVVPFDWSPDGRRILLCQFSRAVQQLYIYDLQEGSVKRLDHPGGTFGFFASFGVYFGTEGEIFTQWQDSTHPGRLIALDEPTGKQTRTVLAAGEVPPGRPWKSVTFASSDGQDIQGWLAMPEGDGPYPAIVHTHGGPEAVTTELFGAASQAWLDHGFAFLTINYRGSTTFGREFQQKIWGNPGNWEVEDVAAARDWLVQAGIARPNQVLLTGGSYGGYLTLLPLGKRPDLWAGGMAVVAIADWAMMYEDSAETLRGYQEALFKGTPQEKPEQYAAGSPITYAERIEAPVLILQGRNDTRCPDRQMEVFVEKLRSLGKPVEIHWFDAGHGAFDVEEQIRQMELMLKFAYRVVS